MQVTYLNSIVMPDGDGNGQEGGEEEEEEEDENTE